MAGIARVGQLFKEDHKGQGAYLSREAGKMKELTLLAEAVEKLKKGESPTVSFAHHTFVHLLCLESIQDFLDENPEYSMSSDDEVAPGKGKAWISTGGEDNASPCLTIIVNHS